MLLKKLLDREEKMTNTILVNLVSDQTLPNVQFIKWYFKENPENLKVLFISTKKNGRKAKIRLHKKGSFFAG